MAAAKDYKVYVLMSDGECDEGSNWEAILFASHQKLKNLVAIVDYNKIQSLDTISKTLELEPFADKWKSFGWHVVEIDGHNHNELLAAFDELKLKQEKPAVLICNTTKGKGVSFMENSVLWHYRSPQGDEFSRAIKELENEIAILKSINERCCRTANRVAEKDPMTMLITGDLGFGVLTDFSKRFPDQFINAGVAEHMTGMAAGLALDGYKVYTYSIGNFNAKMFRAN